MNYNNLLPLWAAICAAMNVKSMYLLAYEWMLSILL